MVFKRAVRLHDPGRTIIPSFTFTMALPFLSTLAAVIAAVGASPLDVRATNPISSITTAQWNSLNQSVGGRLYQGAPLAKPCYSFYNGETSSPDLAQCKAAQDGYVDEVSIANNYGGFVNVSDMNVHAVAVNLSLT